MNLKLSILAVALALGAGQASAQSFTEGFNDGTLPATWVTVNRSTNANNTTGLWREIIGITDGATPPNTVVSPYEGASFAAVSYTSTNSTGTNATISNWLLSPVISSISNGDVFSFYTTTTPASAYPDRLEFRLSTAGTSTNVGTTTTGVGDFTTVLTSINPALAVGGYPDSWTLVTTTISGLAAPVTGRVAFRYFVTQGGINGANSNIIGVDAFSYTAVSAVPEAGTWAMFAAGVVGFAALRRRNLTA